MFQEVELLRHVTVPCLPNYLNTNGDLQRHIVTCLLQNLLSEKGSQDLGHFIAVTKIKTIGKPQALDDSGKRTFPVLFDCRTFIPCRGEILEGKVHRINRTGAFINCGPVRYGYLSASKMPGYRFVQEGTPAFVNDELSKIAVGVVVRFTVLGVKWIKGVGPTGCLEKEYVMLVSINGSSLGPISLCGTDGLDL